MRGLLIAVGVVVLVAAGAVGYVIYKQTAAKPQTAAVAVAPEAVKPAVVKAPARPAPAPVEKVAVPAAEPEAEASAASAVAATTGSFDPNALLGQLDKKQQEALQASMMANLISQGMKGNHYQLPMLNKMRSLDYRDRGKNKLTAAQQAQLKTVMQNIKPQMDAALKDSWAKQDALMGQLGQMISKGMADPSAAENDPQLQQQAMNFGKQMEELEKSMQPQLAAFDQQVLAGMTPYLTPEQVAALQAMPAEGEQRMFFVEPKGGGLPPPEGAGSGPVMKQSFSFTSTVTTTVEP